MESEIVTTEYTSNTGETQQQTTMIQREATSTQSLGEQVLLFGYRASKLVDELPRSFTYFFEAYKQLFVTVVLMVVALIAFKLLLTVLGAINDLPLLAPTFRLIGLVYSTWFTYRYVIGAANRQELGETFQSMKEYVLGRGTQSN